MNLAPLLAVSLLVLPSLGRAASFIPLGDLPDGTGSYSTGVSADGSVVVGYANATLPLEAFRWNDGQMAGLGTLAGFYGSSAYGVSDDGSVVVGNLLSETTNGEAFRWSGGVMTGLGLLPGSDGSSAWGVSGNGEVVVGHSGVEAVRWVGGSIAGLGFIPGGTYSTAYDASADGAVIVGSAHDPAFDNEMAFRWQNGVMSSLTDYPAGVVYSTANAISADGAFVVGAMGGPIGGDSWRDEAFRWSEGEMLRLGLLSNLEFSGSSASDVSADGSVVVGSASTDDGTIAAFIWTEADGMQALVDILAANGATGFEGWNLEDIASVSPDGTWVTGYGFDPDGNGHSFLANISVPAPTTAWLLGSALAALACARARGGRRSVTDIPRSRPAGAE